MLRIAYCQISAHPAYCGPSGNFCKEPVYCANGSIFNELKHINEVDKICTKIEELYNNKFTYKIQQLLLSLKGKDIDIIVFPEYTIPAECLQSIYDFCQSQKCICIAASHTIQQSHKSIYEHIDMDISLDDHLNMSCCPIIFPENKTKFFFKRHKSKWEANMDVEEYQSKNNIFTFNCKQQRVSVLLCIDALHIDIDKRSTDILIVPAASPSDGCFKNKFESHLAKEIPTVFCNFYSFGYSTVYCSVPQNTNLPFAEKNNFTKTAPNEEVVVIIDINEASQATKSHTINTTTPITVNHVLPLFYRDDISEQKTFELMKEYAKSKNYEKLVDICKNISTSSQGITAKKNYYLCSEISERNISFDKTMTYSEFVYINDFSLKQYELNWLNKSMQIIIEGLTSNKINANVIGNVISKLGQEYQRLSHDTKENIDIPVFDQRSNTNSIFQNRGGEINQFRDVQQNKSTTVFVIQGFSQIGKSAFIERLKFLYSFNTIDCRIPKDGGFESLLRNVFQICDLNMEWETLDNQEIEKYSIQFANHINSLNKTLVVLRTTGNIFDDYHKSKTSHFIRTLAQKLGELQSGIKFIIENSRVLPDALKNHPNITICKLRPLMDMYIERLIEQTANNIAFSFSLPRIPKSTIRQCHGNPSIARMIGVYIGERLNSDLDENIPQEDLESFVDKYADEILNKLNISNDERELLIEATIYRLQVPEMAFKELPHYSEKSFRILKDKLLIEENDDWCSVNKLIANSLKRQISEQKKLHEIAARYFNHEYEQNEAYISKAEYFYHLSFCVSKFQFKDDLKYYANDILSASKELINYGEFEIAQSHLDNIRFFCQSYNKSEFLFFYALCHIANEKYDKYHELFNKAIECSKKSQDVLYYRMIDKLIGIRQITEAENLLNEVCDKYPHTRQMDALWVKYYYKFSKQTRDKALDMAIKLTHDSPGDFYSAKILVNIYLEENMIDEARIEIEYVLKYWRTNDWALKMQRLIDKGRYTEHDELCEYEEDDVVEN